MRKNTKTTKAAKPRVKKAQATKVKVRVKKISRSKLPSISFAMPADLFNKLTAHAKSLQISRSEAARRGVQLLVA